MKILKQIALTLLGNIYLPPKKLLLDTLIKLSIGLQLWLVLSVIPITATFLSCILMILRGELVNVSLIWTNFYFYGEILEIEAWRIHLSILFVLACFCLTMED